MKSFRIKITCSETTTVTEEEWRKEGGIGEFNEFAASQYAEDKLIKELRKMLFQGLSQWLQARLTQFFPLKSDNQHLEINKQTNKK